jgi:CheY-like chemotaxis protein/HPt (histidine-containing phosphotransfer) domain-containing protein
MRIRSDSLRLRQILNNIIGNALKFTHAGGVQIDMKWTLPPAGSHRGGKLEFTVTDTGIGMSFEQQQRLFQPFVQGDSSVTRRYGGTGLGLFLSRRLARVLGGDLEVTRSAPGAGSTFTVSIDPRTEAGAATTTWSTTYGNAVAPTFAMPAQTPRLDGVHVLIVEDGLDNQIILREVLQADGATVSIARDGIEAIRLFNDGMRCDIALMDVQMPGLDGYETTRELRRLGAGFPIIALTANAMRGERDRSLAAGCNDYLTKPVDFDVLLDAVARILSRSGGAPRVPQLEPLLSTLRNDPRVAQVLGGFLERLPQRLEALGEAVGRGDLEKAARLAHALRGTAGNYGYPAVASTAAEIEACALDGEAGGALRDKLSELSELCARAALGRPAGSER